VDDGSTDPLDRIRFRKVPYVLTVLRQAKLGATEARNLGARHSRGEVLIFVDDDIVLRENALQLLAEECSRYPAALVMGRLTFPDRLSGETVIASDALLKDLSPINSSVTVHFTRCMTGLLAVRRTDFLSLGMLRDPTGGWPNWDDVEFGYRAHRHGYEVRLTTGVLGEHWDESLADPVKTYRRAFEAARSAARLFVGYPELQSELPMFDDKAPIDLNADSPHTIVRKAARSVVSSPPVSWLMELSTTLLAKWYPSSRIAARMSRWVIGTYTYQGFRAGLRST
jgi:glycosyltransferase involved in cell wall biosynthesis